MKVLSGITCITTARALLVHHKANEEFVMESVHTTEQWKRECGSTKVKHSFSFLEANNPGAGMNPGNITPFQSVFKDGYMLVACVKDSMYVHGDKFGANKYDYKIADTANSSIVHYTEHVPKEDREPMTHAVCFEFCRGIEDMGFFGISNGRDCYCTPYYKPMASDSSECDAVCEGDNTLMCGGPKKNSLFSMHTCADTMSDLTTAWEEGTEAGRALQAVVTAVNDSANLGEADAGAWQKALGAAGDPAGSAQMQKAKIFAGKCRDDAADSKKIYEVLKTSVQVVNATTGPFTDYDVAKAAEVAVKDAKKATYAAEDSLELLEQVAEKLVPTSSDASGSAAQFYPLMYFVDKKFEKFPSTCDGELAADPIMTVSMDECAAACNALPGKCVGIGFYQRTSSVCFLYSKFNSVQYWTGCEEFSDATNETSLDDTNETSLAQVSTKTSRSQISTCSAKLQMFEGTTLKPDPEGKCKQCLKEATKANRCYA